MNTGLIVIYPSIVLNILKFVIWPLHLYGVDLDSTLINSLYEVYVMNYIMGKQFELLHVEYSDCLHNRCLISCLFKNNL